MIRTSPASFVVCLLLQKGRKLSIRRLIMKLPTSHKGSCTFYLVVQSSLVRICLAKRKHEARLLGDFPVTVTSPKLSANFKFNQPIYYCPYYACLLCNLLCVAIK